MGKMSLYRIAEDVREAFELWTIDESALKDAYATYTKVDDIAGFLRQARTLFPCLNCGLATVYLQRYVGGDIVQGSYETKGHTFLSLQGTIVDITADQFGGPRVFVGSLQKPWAAKRMTHLKKETLWKT